MQVRRPDWGDTSAIWQQRAERARSCAEEAQERAHNGTHLRFKQQMLKLAKRYGQMANMAEKAAQNWTSDDQEPGHRAVTSA